MSIKKIVRNIVPRKVWKSLRLQKIICAHERVADLCDTLIEDCLKMDAPLRVTPLKQFEDENIIWQYWAQGFENVPPVIAECVSSIDRNKGAFRIIRLTDANYQEYIRFPESVSFKINLMSKAHFSDILRVALLEIYGGVWIDATIMLTGEIPPEFLKINHFVFQRNPAEPNKEYWENTYAYYFGWADGFRVNMLSSFMVAKKGNPVMAMLAKTLLHWWENNDYLPDYFMLQILYDVLINGYMQQYKCPIVSDCIPHYMQQSINDPRFNIMEKERIAEEIHIHKLTYK